MLPRSIKVSAKDIKSWPNVSSYIVEQQKQITVINQGGNVLRQPLTFLTLQ